VGVPGAGSSTIGALGDGSFNVRVPVEGSSTIGAPGAGSSTVGALGDGSSTVRVPGEGSSTIGANVDASP